MNVIHIFSDAENSAKNGIKTASKSAAKAAASKSDKTPKIGVVSHEIITIEYDGYKFGFARDKWGIGYWFNLSRRPGKYGSCLGITVPMMYWGELTEAAVAAGHTIDYGHRASNPDEDTVSSFVRSKKKSAEDSIKIFF